jgi:hypothetical protein
MMNLHAAKSSSFRPNGPKFSLVVKIVDKTAVKARLSRRVRVS